MMTMKPSLVVTIKIIYSLFLLCQPHIWLLEKAKANTIWAQLSLFYAKQVSVAVFKQTFGTVECLALDSRLLENMRWL